MAIARTLAADPDVVLYDEPTSGLDSASGAKVADLNGDETDGLDEVFLPADITRAKAGASTIPNGIEPRP